MSNFGKYKTTRCLDLQGKNLRWEYNCANNHVYCYTESYISHKAMMKNLNFTYGCLSVWYRVRALGMEGVALRLTGLLVQYHRGTKG